MIKVHFPHTILAMETNGTSPDAMLQLKCNHQLIDYITLSPKEQTHEMAFAFADEVKVVYDGIVDPNTYKHLINIKFRYGLAFIQPCSENYKPAVEFVLNNPEWRLSVQIQKVINVR